MGEEVIIIGQYYEQMSIDGVGDGSKEKYEAFTDKFKPKKTTDDCYTPPGIMEAVNEYVAKEYGRDPDKFIRPFWPGGDYKSVEYPEGCTVVDNPPFSILKDIYSYYNMNGVAFFLFTPTLSSMTCMRKYHDKCCVILVGTQIIYENGAEVNTSFTTNLDDRYAVRTAPELYKKLDLINKQNAKVGKKQLPKYIYPRYVMTGGAYTLSKYGQQLNIQRAECRFISAMEQQREVGKAIFGGGLLLSERAAAERAAAERAAAERAAAERAAAKIWELSEMEKRMIKEMGERKKTER